MAVRLQIRRGSAAEWNSVNPVLAEGELGVELDTLKFKIGNGTQSWNDIAYATGIQGPRGERGLQGQQGTMSEDQLEQLNAAVKNEANVQKLKYEGGKLYVFDGETWHETKGGGEGIEVDGMELVFDEAELEQAFVIDVYTGAEDES